MLEKLKEDLIRKIERGSIKSELNGEIVYMKKSKLPLIGDWARIYPPINEDGTWNLTNFIFGGKQNLWKLLISIGIIAMVFFAFYEVLNGYEVLANHPCVSACIETTSQIGNVNFMPELR